MMRLKEGIICPLRIHHRCQCLREKRDGGRPSYRDVSENIELRKLREIDSTEEGMHCW